VNSGKEIVSLNSAALRRIHHKESDVYGKLFEEIFPDYAVYLDKITGSDETETLELELTTDESDKNEKEQLTIKPFESKGAEGYIIGIGEPF